MPIEQVLPEIECFLPLDQEPEQLGSGYSGEAGPAEGPVWWKEGGYLLFSDIGNNRRMKWAPDEGVTVFREPTNYANGLTRDLQGRLIACEGGTRRVTRLEHDGKITIVADSYHGSQLNRPNDVVVKSDGSIYFTDPGAKGRPGPDLDYPGVYRVSPDLATITLLVRDFVLPNGLAFSPDESILYIDDTRRRHIRAFDMQATGELELASDRVFCDLSGHRLGFPDGMKVDTLGNVYCGGSGGIWIMSASGNHLGTIVHGGEGTTNMSWGGDDWKTLFFTTWRTLCRIELNIPGLPVPTGV